MFKGEADFLLCPGYRRLGQIHFLFILHYLRLFLVFMAYLEIVLDQGVYKSPFYSALYHLSGRKRASSGTSSDIFRALGHNKRDTLYHLKEEYFANIVFFSNCVRKSLCYYPGSTEEKCENSYSRWTSVIPSRISTQFSATFDSQI
jgi:hypothetical protein